MNRCSLNNIYLKESRPCQMMQDLMALSLPSLQDNLEKSAILLTCQNIGAAKQRDAHIAAHFKMFR